MTKKKDPADLIRKAKAPKGERHQVRTTILIDLENWEHLQTQMNKGRYINNLIKADREKD